MNTETLMQAINDGLMISIIGMTVVMFFLTLMMYVMKSTDKVMAKLAVWFPEEVKEEPTKKVQSNNDSDIAVVIATAKNFFAKGGN